MEPTFAYWATAQQSGFDVEYTRVAETKQAIFSLATSYPQVCGFENEGVSVSPDRNWIAMDCRYAGDFFRVFQTNENRIWDIPFSAIFEFYPEFLGSVRALNWSGDGDYLYFANRSCCADTDAETNGDALYRLNLQTGDWKLLISGIFNYYWFFPDGQRLLYILNNQAGANNFVRLHLLDIKTGEEELMDVDNFEQAWVVWNHDGMRLALIAQTGDAYTDNRKFTLVVVDLLQKKPQTIIPLTEDGLGVTAWSDDDILTINRSNVMEYNGDYVNFIREVVFYDLKINQFVKPTSVP
jgi:WD40 repeat protein